MYNCAQALIEIKLWRPSIIIRWTPRGGRDPQVEKRLSLRTTLTCAHTYAVGILHIVKFSYPLLIIIIIIIIKLSLNVFFFLKSALNGHNLNTCREKRQSLGRRVEYWWCLPFPPPDVLPCVCSRPVISRALESVPSKGIRVVKDFNGV